PNELLFEELRLVPGRKNNSPCLDCAARPSLENYIPEAGPVVHDFSSRIDFHSSPSSPLEEQMRQAVSVDLAAVIREQRGWSREREQAFNLPLLEKLESESMP